jgi:iron(III) transport system substrate-binding protein
MPGKCRAVGILALALTCMIPPTAIAQSAEKTWDETLAAARKEGKVVVAGAPDPVMRNEVIPAFTSRYGIAVDYIAGRSGSLVERIKVERASGVYSIDAYLPGSDTMFNVLYPEKMIDPLKPMLISPEVTDPSKWKSGKLWFMDPEEKYVLRVFNSVDSLLFINTDFVKPEEMVDVKDLLNPKWKGKISTEDPLLDSGNGGNTAARFYKQLGPDFVKKLYIDQKPTISRDRRQFTDWMARGTHPICLSCREDDVRHLRQEGYKLLKVYNLNGLVTSVNTSPFLIAVANKAPHPNAARIFLNWLAGKEALEIYSRGFGAATLRTDVDESFLDPRLIPDAKVDYPDTADPNWRSKEKLEITKKIGLLLKDR